MQIIVLGMHRSGTSVVTRLINMMGAYFGTEQESVGANEENPKGFWERWDVIQCNDSILKQCSSTWDNVYALTQKGIPDDCDTSAAEAIVSRLDPFRPWVIKDPRLCVTFPAWKRVLTKPIVVIVHRDAMEVAESLYQRDRIPIQAGLALWEYYMGAALNAAIDIPKLFVGHHEVLRQPVETCRRLVSELSAHGVHGLSMPDESLITDFIDPALYRSKPPKEREEKASPEQVKMMAFASGQASLLSPVELSPKSKDYLKFYAYTCEGKELLQTKHDKLSGEYYTMRDDYVKMREEFVVIKDSYDNIRKKDADHIAGLERECAELKHNVESLEFERLVMLNSLRWKMSSVCAAICNFFRPGR